MNQEQEGSPTPFEHYFKEDQIRFTAKVEIPVIPLQITYQIDKNQDGHAIIQFSSGLQYYISQNEQQELVYWIDQTNSDLVSTLVQQLNAIPVEKYQQPAQQNVPHIIIEIVDVGRKQNFSGSISEENISALTNEQEDSDTILEFVKENIEAALNPASSFYIKLDKDVCEITIKILQETKKKNAPRKEFILQVPMVKQEVNEQVIENIKEQTLQEKINEQISHVQQQFEQLSQQVQTPNPKIQEHEQRIAQQELALQNTQNSIQQQEQSLHNVQQQLQGVVQNQQARIEQLETNVTNLQNQTQLLGESLSQSQLFSQQLQQFVQQLTEQIQQQQAYIQQLSDQIVQQSKKPQPTQVQVNQFGLKQQDVVQGNLFLTPVQNDEFTELQFVIDDEDAEYSIGILEGGDLDNLENRVRAFFFDFPDGKLTRGAEESLRFLPRQILRNDRFGIRVDKKQSKLIVTLNGQELPPVNLRADFGAFSFALKTDKEISEIFSVDQDC